MASFITAGNATNGLQVSSDNTGILELRTGTGSGTTALTLNTSQNATFAGNVGIGTSSPATRFHVLGTSSEVARFIRDNTAAASGGITIGNNSRVFTIYGDSNALSFWDTTAAAERARITSGGDFGINSTSPAAKLDVIQDSVSANGGRVAYFRSTAAGDVANNAVIISKFDNNTTTSQIFMKFEVNNTATSCGRINANGANTAAFGSTSDQRVKENIENLPSQLQNILALRPVEFDYIESYGGGHQIGFIAQEMQEVYPDVVSADDSEERILSITGWSKTEARLVKAIQELKAELDATKAEVAALKAQP